MLAAFAGRGLAAARVGRVDASRRLTLAAAGERALVWDLGAQPLTGFGQAERAGRHERPRRDRRPQ